MEVWIWVVIVFMIVAVWLSGKKKEKLDTMQNIDDKEVVMGVTTMKSTDIAIKYEVDDVNSTNIMKNESINNSLFAKLSNIITDAGYQIDGRSTIWKYIDSIEKNGYTWFCTNSLSGGMSKDNLAFYKNKIAEKKKILIYFGINDIYTDNDIAYQAEVLDIISDSYKIEAPCSEEEYPLQFHKTRAKLWIKITNMQEEKVIHAKDMQVISTKKNLKWVITKGQFSFGYIKRISEC